MEPEQLLSQAKVIALLDCGETTFRHWLRKGLFPPPSFVLGKVKKWNWQQVQEFLIAAKLSKIQDGEK